MRKRAEIEYALQQHLSGDGTANDDTTDELYREYYGIEEEDTTDLEEVENWAFNVVNGDKRNVNR